MNKTGFEVLRKYRLGIDIEEISNQTGLTSKEVKGFLDRLDSLNILLENETEREKYNSSVGENIEVISTSLKSPIRVSWLITNKCNLKCKHCYIRARPESNHQELDLSEIKDILFKLSEAGTFIIYFTGGEPFCRDDFLEILREASNLGMEIAISTNGILLNEETIKELSNLNILKMQVSLDGAKRETHEFIRGEGTFEPTLEAIRNLIEVGIDTGITFVCHEKNFDEIKDILELGKELGSKGVKISPLMNWGRAKDSLKGLFPSRKERVEIKKRAISSAKRLDLNLLDELYSEGSNNFYLNLGMPELEGEYGCPLAMGFSILPNGKVIPCEVFSENLTEEVVIGDIQEKKVKEIWSSPKAKKFRKSAVMSNKEPCQGCDYLSICGTYCLAENYIEYGKLTPPKNFFGSCRKFHDEVLNGN